MLLLGVATAGYQLRPQHRRTSRPMACAASDDDDGGGGVSSPSQDGLGRLSRVQLTVDLGRNGEPAGPSNVVFTPILPRSTFLQLDLKVPLGMNIEVGEEDDLYPGSVRVTGALPGYSAAGEDGVQAGDFIRGVTAYRSVMGGGVPRMFSNQAPMWQQLFSYTPSGKLELKRLFFRTEGATFDDVREAIASHKEEGANQTVTLVLERPVDVSSGEEGTPRLDGAPKVEPLQDVILRDLKKGPVKGVEEELDKLSAPERAGRLLSPDDDIFKRNL